MSGSIEQAAWRPDAGARTDAIWIAALGITAGVAGAFVAELELPWIGFLVLACSCAVVLLAVRDTVAFMGAAFVLSLQADAAYRVFYGRAGSDGMAIPLCVLVGMAWVGLRWLSSRAESARPTQWAGPMATPIALLFAASIVSWLLSTEHFVGATVLLFHLELYFVFWLAIQLVQSTEDLNRVTSLLLATLAIQCTIYFVQSAIGLSFTLEGDMIEQGTVARPGGTIATNPAGFASFVIPILMVTAARFLLSTRRNERFYLGILVGMGVLAIGLTFTRVAWAGLVFGFAMLLVMTWRRGYVSTTRLTWVVISLCAVAVVLTPIMLIRMAESPLDEAYSERRGLMTIAFEVIRSHPLTGIGPGAYGFVYKRYLPPTLDDQWLYTVHNEYLLRAAETGLLGALAWILLLVIGMRLAWRISRSAIYEVQTLGLGWSAGLLAVAWQMYWVPWDGFQYNALLWFFLGLSVAACRIITAPAISPKSRDGLDREERRR